MEQGIWTPTTEPGDGEKDWSCLWPLSASTPGLRLLPEQKSSPGLAAEWIILSQSYFTQENQFPKIA